LNAGLAERAADFGVAVGGLCDLGLIVVFFTGPVHELQPFVNMS